MADILEASIRVLRREGGHRFTTTRVAAEAGVSVGSLYQYFPNKNALLFRLQLDEWAATARLFDSMLADASVPAVKRLHRTVIAFFQTEVEERDLRRALDDASGRYRDSPEARAALEQSGHQAREFIRGALPNRAPTEVDFLADFFVTAIGAIAEKVTDRNVTSRELERWAQATASLLIGYLEELQSRSGR